MERVGSWRMFAPEPKTTLPETNSEFTPENGWLEDEAVSFWDTPIFRCELLVSGRVTAKTPEKMFFGLSPKGKVPTI